MREAHASPSAPQGHVGVGLDAASVLAAGFYFAVALFAMRSVVPAPRTLVPFPANYDDVTRAVNECDQRFVIASIYQNARTMPREPSALLNNGQCYPMPHSITLGEHMYGEGLLGVLPALLTRDPIATYNAVVVLSLWIPALTMYALVRYWTGSVAAALVAGFLFAFQPGRIGDPTHPMVHGDLWTPLVLLFAHRVLRDGRWTDTAALAVAFALQLLESIYPLVALAILGSVYGPYLLLRFARVLPKRLPQLLAVTVALIATAVLVLGPYLWTQRVWGLLTGRGSLLFEPRYFMPGNFYYPGTVMIGLALVGIADRMRGARVERGYDPRFVVLVAGLLVLWSVVWGVRIPGVGFIPSPYLLLIDRVEGLQAVRAFPAVRIGFYLSLVFLAGWGVLALVERRSARTTRVVTVVLLTAAGLEIFWPWLSTLSLGETPVQLATSRLAPPGRLVAALDALLPPGPVLDVPLVAEPGVLMLVAMSHQILLQGYHGRHVAACYNSFVPPTVADVAGMAARLPAPEALIALRAAGFASIVVHEELLPPDRREELASAFAAAAANPVGPVRLVRLGAAEDHTLWSLVGEVDADRSFGSLAGGAGAPVEARVAAAPDGVVPFHFRNAGARPYRHPDPIEPTQVVVTWRRDGDGAVSQSGARVLLPIALAGGESTVRDVRLALPPGEGRYDAAMALADAPDLVVGRARVEVTAGARSDATGGGA